MKRTLFALALAGIASLSSCSKDAFDDLTTPQVATPSQAASAQAADLPVFTTPHRLIKHANRTLSYDQKNRLVKVTEGNLVTTYEYMPGHCYLVIKKDGTMTHRVVYHLNASGRTTIIETSKLVGFKQVNNYQEPVYGYNKYKVLYDGESGRLGLIMPTTYDDFEKYEFKYDASKHLSQIKYYNHNGLLTRTTTLAYDKPYAGPLQYDLCELNPDINEFYMEPYLNIFGSFSTYLVRSRKVETTNALISSEYYKYKLTNDGYVTAKDHYNGLTHAYQGSTPFEFVTIPPVLSPISQ